MLYPTQNHETTPNTIQEEDIIKLPINKIVWGDSARIVRTIPQNSIDLVLTDPPYGIKFLGHHWDKALPPSQVWIECLRVLKPGAFAFVFCIPRADCLSRMIQDLEKGGFEVSFTPIFWAFASGMPKATNIGKAIDKRLGVKPTIVGKKPYTNQDIRSNAYTTREATKRERLSLPLTTPTTKRGKEFSNAYGSFLPKPAIEVIIVAMKPLSEKTYIDQALKNRKGVVWFDDCKIPAEKEVGWGGSKTEGYCGGYKKGTARPSRGRFPANLLISDSILDCGRKTKSVGGKAKNSKRYSGGFNDAYYEGVKPGFGDTGDFSRYFSLDKWWEEKLKELPKAVQKTFPFMIVNKTRTKEKERGCERLPKKEVYPEGNKLGLNTSPTRPDGSRRKSVERKNTHSTVKPIELVSYLITLGSRESDIVLDPFIGTGTTAIASTLLNRKYIGIEKEEEYINIAHARLRAYTKEA